MNLIYFTETVLFSDNHFDVPDRTFHSIHKCYDLVTSLSITDTKELIPEFFYLPEFLENGEGLCALEFRCFRVY
jgi:hypothetical protein